MKTPSLNNPKRVSKGFFNLSLNNDTCIVYSSDFAQQNSNKDFLYFTFSVNGIPCYIKFKYPKDI